MAVYLVTWDLNKEGYAYTQARDALIALVEETDYKKHSGLDSVVFINSTSGVKEVYEYLAQALDGNDRLVVVQVSTWWGNLGTELAEWIRARS